MSNAIVFNVGFGRAASVRHEEGLIQKASCRKHISATLKVSCIPNQSFIARIKPRKARLRVASGVSTVHS